MFSIAEKIRALPVLKLATQEWLALATIIAENDINDVTALQALLKESAIPTSLQTHAEKIVAYVTIWFELCDLLMALNKKILHAWQATAGSEASLATDDLLPFTMQLLPHDLGLLENLLPPLRQACELVNGGEASFYLINFYSAVEAKITDIREKKLPQEDARIENAIIEFNLQEKIDCLELTCISYLKVLAKMFEKKLEKKDKLVYLYYYKNCDQNCETVLKEIIENADEECGLLPDDESLNQLISKYDKLTNLLQILLTAQFNKADQLTTFTTQFREMKSALEKNATHEEIQLLTKMYNQLNIKTNSFHYSLFYKFLPDAIHLDTLTPDYLAKWLPKPKEMRDTLTFFALKLMRDQKKITLPMQLTFARAEEKSLKK